MSWVEVVGSGWSWEEVGAQFSNTRFKFGSNMAHLLVTSIII